MTEQIELMKCKNADVSSLKFFLQEKNETDLLKEHLSEIMDWNLIFTAVSTFQHYFNERLVRMLKSYLLSEGIQIFSNNKLHFLDETGYDFVTDFLGKKVKIEFKHGKNLFQGDKTSYTKSIKLDSTNGQSSFFKDYEKTFDYLLLIDEKMSAIISYEDVQKYIKNNGDGRSVRIHKKDLTFIKECTVVKTNKKVFVDNFLKKLVNECLQQVVKLRYS